jgi:hypothetical protein
MEIKLFRRESAEEKLQRRVNEAAAQAGAIVSTLLDQGESPPFKVGIGRNPFKQFDHNEADRYISSVWGGALSILSDLSLGDKVQLDTQATNRINSCAARDGTMIRIGLKRDLTLFVRPPQS